MSTRALIAGVSGLRSHALKMDVIGNNIANINTVGFKSSKALFEDLISQTVNGGTGAQSGGTGGLNPIQVGLGTRLGSIQTDFSQGSLQATGKVTDLAISGNGYFVLNDGTETLYSRDGAFSLNSLNQLVNPANGFRVQGWQADADGTLNTLTTVGNIEVPFGSSTVSNATSTVRLVGNLNSGGSDSVPEVAESGRIWTDAAQTLAATTASSLTGLFDNSGNALNLEVGDTITLGATRGAGSITTRTFTVQTGDTLEELRQFMQDTLGIVADGNTTISEGVTMSGTSGNQLVVTSNIGSVNN